MIATITPVAASRLTDKELLDCLEATEARCQAIGYTINASVPGKPLRYKVADAKRLQIAAADYDELSGEIARRGLLDMTDDELHAIQQG